MRGPIEKSGHLRFSRESKVSVRLGLGEREVGWF